MATIRGADTPSVYLVQAVDRLTNGPSFINPMDSCTDAVDSVHRTMDLFYDIFFRKIIPKIWKIAGTWNFAKIPLNFSIIMF
jgi:hypothetical protein